MAGIVFLRTQDLDAIVQFYTELVGMTKWLSQPDVEILRDENMLIGFHQQSQADTDSLLTFFYESSEMVDQMYQKLKHIAFEPPKRNDTYQIYNFFAKDPEGRTIEFQYFLHELPDY